MIPKGSTTSKMWLLGLILGPLVVLTVGMITILLWRKSAARRKRKAEEMSLDVAMENDFDRGISARKFTYKELALATNNFSENRKLGEGGFGGVYRGFLSDLKLDVAVKKISRSSKQGKKEYMSEVKIISRLRHRNLVKLIGWSHESGELLLVYEFMPNGSLDSHLFTRKNNRSSLTWVLRYNIAVGLASALVYLHEDLELCVVHRDIKPSNVMLDSNFNAKLGDFSLARLADHRSGLRTTKLAGTWGYLAPECVITGKASKESDVFSFGIVALELATGRRAVDHNREEEEVRLVDWVWELNGAGRILDAADGSLDMDFDGMQMEHLMVVGLWCAHPDQSQRPSMRQVLKAMNFEEQVPPLPEKPHVPLFVAPSLPLLHTDDLPSVKITSLVDCGR